MLRFVKNIPDPCHPEFISGSMFCGSEPNTNPRDIKSRLQSSNLLELNL